LDVVLYFVTALTALHSILVSVTAEQSDFYVTTFLYYFYSGFVIENETVIGLTAPSEAV
jgi:hypothetical protein